MKPVPSPYAELLARTSVTASTVDVDGVRTAYWEYGRPSESVPTLLFLHGFRGEHHGLESIIAFLPDAHILVPDLPGFGESEPLPDEHSIANYATWLQRFVAALELGPETIVLGHSFGTIVLAAALAEGLPVARAILVNPIAAPALAGPNALGTRLASLYYRVGGALPERIGGPLLQIKAVMRGAGRFLIKTKDPVLRAWINDQHDRYFSSYANRRVVLEAYRASVDHDITEYVDRIRVPLHLIASERDDITALADVTKLRDRVPGTTMIVIPDVGHLVHYETPEPAAREIARVAGIPWTSAAERSVRLVVDCRYVRADGRHDGISRYAAGITRGLAELVPLTMLISDVRQLELLPDLPWVRTRPVTHPLEPFIPRVVGRLAPDVVFSPLQTSGSLGRRYGLVLTLHDLIYYRHRPPPVEFPWWVRLGWRLLYVSYLPQRWLLDRADEVVTVSETVEAQIARHHLTSRRVTVVPNAPDTAPLGAAPPPPREKLLVYMGAFMGYKNVATLVRAAAQLPDYELHLLSPIGATERASLERIAGAARLVFHDGIAEAEYTALLDRATALVSASLDEGFGLPVVEAMNRGLPTVLSDIPIFREVGGAAALYVAPHHAHGFASVVRRLEDPGEWQRQSNSALAHVATFSWAASARRLLPVLERVAASRRHA